MEVELKLLISPSHVRKLQSLPQLKKLALHAPTVQDMTSVYFDTPDLFIQRSEAGLRVRQANGRWIQTLKAGGSVQGGLHRRNEWESPVASPAPVIGDLVGLIERGTRWRDMLRANSLAEELQPIFSTRFRRTAWQLRLKTGDELECALDQGVIECKGDSLPICEVEMELKSGSPANLFRFALALIERVPLRIGNVSKAQRGYEMYAPQPLRAASAVHVKLTRKLDVEQGFQRIFLNCMAQIQDNETGVASSIPECVHQMRVGLRRLRCALKLFSGTIDFPAGLRKELSWLATELGEARDWDVLAMVTLPFVAAATGNGADLAAAVKAANHKAKSKRRRAAQAVNSTRYAKLILAAHAWLHARPWSTSAKPGDPLEKFADKILTGLKETLLKRGERLGDGNEARHRVRIAAKNVRYASEFFQSLYPARQVRRYIGKLAELQDELGRLNDAAVADRLLRELQSSRPGALGAGYARGYLRASVEHGRDELQDMWRALRETKDLARR